MKTLHIQAISKDFNTILDLLKEAAHALKVKGTDQWSYWLNPPEEKVTWLKEGITNNEFYFIRNTKGTLMGMFRLLFEDELYWGKQKEEAGYVHSLVVKDEFKGQQIGKHAMKQIEELLIDKGIHLFRLDCVANNKRLCSYYESFGFKQVGQKQMPLSLNNLYEKRI